MNQPRSFVMYAAEFGVTMSARADPMKILFKYKELVAVQIEIGANS